MLESKSQIMHICTTVWVERNRGKREGERRLPHEAVQRRYVPAVQAAAVRAEDRSATIDKHGEDFTSLKQPFKQSAAFILVFAKDD